MSRQLDYKMKRYRRSVFAGMFGKFSCGPFKGYVEEILFSFQDYDWM